MKSAADPSFIPEGTNLVASFKPFRPRFTAFLRIFTFQSKERLIAKYSEKLSIPARSSIFDIADQQPCMNRDEFQSYLEMLKIMNVKQRERLKKVLLEMEQVRSN